MTTQALRSALRKRCPAPGWALLEEVRESVGHGAKRSADAIAMSTWEGRGLELHGFELKASRADWLRELKAPEKAEAFSAYCERWWIVASDRDVVLDGELPPAWGLLVLRGKVLHTIKEAPKREHVIAPDRGFLAAMLRRATEQFATMVHEDEVKERIREQVEATVVARSVDPKAREHRERAEQLDSLEARLGVRLHGIGDLETLAAAYKLIRDVDGMQWQVNRIEQAADAAARIAKDLRGGVKLLREAREKPKKPGEESAA